MKILSALFDLALLPLAVGKDFLDYGAALPKSKSDTRRKLEQIEEHLGL